MKKITDSERNARLQISAMLRAARAGFSENPQDNSREVRLWQSYAAGVRTRLVVQVPADVGDGAALTLRGAKHLLRRLERAIKRLEARKPKRTAEHYPWCPRCGDDEPRGEVCPKCAAAPQTDAVVDELLSVAIDRARSALAIGEGWTPEEIDAELAPWPKVAVDAMTDAAKNLAGIKRTVVALDKSRGAVRSERDRRDALEAFRRRSTGETVRSIGRKLRRSDAEVRCLVGIGRRISAVEPDPDAHERDLPSGALGPDPELPSLDGPSLRANVRLVGGTPKPFAARLVKWNGAPIDEPGRCDGIVDGLRCALPLGHLATKCCPNLEGD